MKIKKKLTKREQYLFDKELLRKERERQHKEYTAKGYLFHIPLPNCWKCEHCFCIKNTKDKSLPYLSYSCRYNEFSGLTSLAFKTKAKECDKHKQSFNFAVILK